MAEKMNLIQKLAKIRNMSGVVGKSKSGYGYNYADITEILAKITAGMKKYKVTLIPSIVPSSSQVVPNSTRTTKLDKTGKSHEVIVNEMIVTADMVFKWVDDENPDDIIEIPWFVTGAQNDPSQAFGSGLTYCTRYFLCSYFQIAQPDNDVDTYRSKQKAAIKAEEQAILVEIIEELDKLVNGFLETNKDKASDVKKFVSAYIKGANYFDIKEPDVAAKLLRDFKQKYLEKGE